MAGNHVRRALSVHVCKMAFQQQKPAGSFTLFPSSKHIGWAALGVWASFEVSFSKGPDGKYFRAVATTHSAGAG